MNETKLTHAQIETLQYILNQYMFNNCTMHSIEHTALKNKLILMRAELEYLKTYYTLSSNGDITINL
jgi:hypothetical protein